MSVAESENPGRKIPYPNVASYVGLYKSEDARTQQVCVCETNQIYLKSGTRWDSMGRNEGKGSKWMSHRTTSLAHLRLPEKSLFPHHPR